MKGRAARFAFDPAVLVAFLDSHAEYRIGGHPARRRHLINGCFVRDTDARVIRRWRGGKIQGVTKSAANGVLERHGLTVPDFTNWAEANGHKPVIRGRLNPVPNR